MLSKLLPRFRFSASADLAQRTFGIFSQRYAANIEAFKQKVGDAAEQGEILKKSTQRAYVHPLHEEHKPVFLGVANAVKTDSELRGPEQVSPHYEHFSMARRQGLIFLGGLIALRFIASTEDFFMFGQSGTYAWCFYYAYSYFWIEGKKYFLMPLLHRFYRKLLNMEVDNMETYWAENTEARIRNLMGTAKEQI